VDQVKQLMMPQYYSKQLVGVPSGPGTGIAADAATALQQAAGENPSGPGVAVYANPSIIASSWEPR
jgi:hypothetical protein